MDRLHHHPVRTSSLTPALVEGVGPAVLGLHHWLETMRRAEGYGGPVAHWWQSCLLYSGPMADWRYEGVVCGYLSLAEADERGPWLEHAVTAGEDLVRAQLPGGNFACSSFEIGPLEGGTPHEAAADIALLELARALRRRDDPRWQRFLAAAEHNIEAYLIGKLWNGNAFRDQAWNETLVANKNATTLEALLLYETLTGGSMEAYIAGCVSVIALAQVEGPGKLTGATVHLGSGPHRLAIGIYTARCAAALIRLYEHHGHSRALDLARPMLGFLVDLIGEQGTRCGYYRDGRAIACPAWVSPSGDLLRALIALQPYVEVPQGAVERLISLLVERQLPSGGIPTAYGLGQKGRTSEHRGLPDFRDVLPVVGWCDKAFRALALLVPNGPLPPHAVTARETLVDCTWKGQTCLYHETPDVIELWGSRRKPLYQWEKGTSYPRVYGL